MDPYWIKMNRARETTIVQLVVLMRNKFGSIMPPRFGDSFVTAIVLAYPDCYIYFYNLILPLSHSVSLFFSTLKLLNT